MISTSATYSSAIDINEFYQTGYENEKRQLTSLNNQFEPYLNKIKLLANTNIDLRQQIVNILQTYIGHGDNEKQTDTISSNSLDMKFNNLRHRLNHELAQYMAVQTRLQRADYDKKYYKNKIHVFAPSDESPIITQQLNSSLSELNLVREQYEKKERDLQLCKKQYNDHLQKLFDYTNDYYKLTNERIQSENSLHTLHERLLFDRTYNQICRQEFERFEKIQYDLNDQFNKIEFKKIIEKIREDYQNYNNIQLSELETYYKIKVDLLQYNFQQNNQENDSQQLEELTERNQLLEQKLKQLEDELHQTNEQNRLNYELSLDKYHQLEDQVSEVESFLFDARSNTVQLTSDINMYRCLLINLTTSTEPANQSSTHRPSNNSFAFHIRNGTIYVRI